MSDTCSRNGCRHDATLWVTKKIEGDLYNIPLCRDHRDGVTSV